MPTPTREEFLDYETNIEDAVAEVLEEKLAAVQVLTPRTTSTDAAKKVTPRIELSLAITGQLEHQAFEDNDVDAEYYDWKTGQLTLRCAIRRNESGQSLGGMRGGIRASFMKGAALFNETNLPFYDIVRLEESGSIPEHEAVNDEIHCVLTFDIEWKVRNDQLPAAS